MKIMEQELKAFAVDASQTIVIRTYQDGNSSDTRRKSTKKEVAILTPIIYGGLLAVRSGYPIRDVASTCEYIGAIQLPMTNCYDSIFRPIMDWKEVLQNDKE